MIVFIELGRRVGRRARAGDPTGGSVGLSAIDGAVFALFGLLIAFTFSGAAARFDDRRKLIIDEANDISTAYNYLDLLPASDQPPMRDLFRKYIDARISTFEKLPDIPAAEAELAVSLGLQDQIWTRAIAICKSNGDSPATMLLLGSLNEMNNITTSRTAATRLHPPATIFGLLFGLGLCSALLAGYGMSGAKAPSWAHIFGFAAVIGLCVYIILDLEYPRLGFIRITEADQVMKDVRAAMH